MSSIHSYHGEVMSERPDYTRTNERLLLRVIKEKLGITDEDMTSPDVVKQKLRDANIEEILN
jgi:hypothetical protein